MTRRFPYWNVTTLHDPCCPRVAQRVRRSIDTSFLADTLPNSAEPCDPVPVPVNDVLTMIAIRRSPLSEQTPDALAETHRRCSLGPALGLAICPSTHHSCGKVDAVP